MQRKQKAAAGSSSAKAGKAAAKTAVPSKSSCGLKRKTCRSKHHAQTSTSTDSAREKKR